MQEIIGTPAGTKGVKESAKRIAKPASTQDLRSESLGQSSPRNAAGTAASKPQADGSPIDCAPSAPASVNRFQKMNTPKPVYQNPLRISASSFCASATPIDSSIVIWAATTRFQPRSFKSGASRSPYKPFRVPRSVEVAIAFNGVPPAAITPTTAN